MATTTPTTTTIVVGEDTYVGEACTACGTSLHQCHSWWPTTGPCCPPCQDQRGARLPHTGTHGTRAVPTGSVAATYTIKVPPRGDWHLYNLRDHLLRMHTNAVVNHLQLYVQGQRVRAAVPDSVWVDDGQLVVAVLLQRGPIRTRPNVLLPEAGDTLTVEVRACA